MPRRTDFLYTSAAVAWRLCPSRCVKNKSARKRAQSFVRPANRRGEIEYVNRSLSLRKGDVGVLLALQLVLAIVTAVAYLWAVGGGAAQAAAYGGGVALLSTLLLGHRVLRAAAVAGSVPGRETAVLYIGAIQRFVLVMALFGFGMGWLRLQPLPLLVGFAVAQAGYFVNGAWLRARADGQVGRLS